MKTKILILVMAGTLLIFNGCSEPEVKTVYIDKPCPNLSTWKVKPMSTSIRYKVVNDG